MTFAHPFFLVGAGVVALPIILHLMFRKKPRRLPFPALRFLREIAPERQRSQRLRSILLLLLRCLLLLFLVLAVARPSVPGRSAATGATDDDGSGPISMVVVLETAPRMAYQQSGRTRLDDARQQAIRSIAALHPESEVAIFDGHGGFDAFEPDRDSALDRLDRVMITPDARSMPALIDEARQLLESGKFARRELCVFTDLTDAAWPIEPTARLATGTDAKNVAAGTPGWANVRVTRVDCGVGRPHHAGLGEVSLTPSVASPMAPVRIETTLYSLGADVTANLKLEISPVDPDAFTNAVGAKNRGNGENAAGTTDGIGIADRLAPQERSVTLAAGRREQVTFAVEGLPPGTYQGTISLAGRDPLDADRVRFFTLRVMSPQRVLIMATEPSQAVFVREALFPKAMEAAGTARFRGQIATYDEFATATFDDGVPQVVFLLDPPQLGNDVWRRLHAMVRRGVGLGVMLGRRTTADAFDSPDAHELLGVTPLAQVRCGEEPLRLDPSPSAYSLPLLAAFRGNEDRMPWSNLPVFRYWNVDAAAGTSVLVRYDDGGAAILQRRPGGAVVNGANDMNERGAGMKGGGTVLVMTTPISDPASDPAAWNFLPTSGASWVFLVLMNQMATQLGQSGADEIPNIESGDGVFLRLEPTGAWAADGEDAANDADEKNATAAEFTSCVLTDPTGMTMELPVEPGAGTTFFADVIQPGNWTVRAGTRRGGVRSGFSVNLSPDATRIDRIPATMLDTRLGVIPWAETEVLDEIAAEKPDESGGDTGNNATVGRTSEDDTRQNTGKDAGTAAAANAVEKPWNGDLFPWMMLLVAMALAGETFLANRFYREAGR